MSRTGFLLLLASTALAMATLSGCSGQAAEAQAAEAAGPLADPVQPAADGDTVVEAVKVLPRAFPIEVVGHIKPGPCASLERPCEFGVGFQPSGQPGAWAGLEWTRLGQSFTEPEGLFWRIRLAGNWTSSTPAVQAVELTVATLAAGCDGCEPRVAFTQRSDGPTLEIGRTDVFLEDGEDTLVYWVQPVAVGPANMQPADDVKVELRGWAAAFVADGDPILLTPDS